MDGRSIDKQIERQTGSMTDIELPMIIQTDIAAYGSLWRPSKPGVAITCLR